MKKIFTLFITTVVALSMYALPQDFKAVKNGQVKQSTEFSAQKDAKHEKVAAAFAANKIERQALPQTEQTKQLAPAAQKLAATKKVAQGEVMTLNFDGFAVLPEYYPETGDWYAAVSCQDDSKPEYGYTVKFDWFAPEGNYCGTFTTENFDHDYSYMYTPYATVFYNEITMTINATKVSEHLEILTLTATIVGDDGITYQVNATHEVIVPEKEVWATLANATLTQNDNGFVLQGKDADVDLNLVVYNPYGGVIGTYTSENYFDLANSTFSYQGTNVAPISLQLSVNVAQTEAGLGYVAELDYLGQDTVQYYLTLEAPMPAPNDTIDITCPNLTVDDSWAASFEQISIEASNSEYSIFGAWRGYMAEEGTYEGDDAIVYVTDKATDLEYESLMAKLVVSTDENGNWAVEGTALCTDNNLYNLHLSWNVPTPTDTVVIAFDKSSKAKYYPHLDNDLLLYNQNDQYYASLDVYGTPIGGEFTNESMDMYYTSIVSFVNGDTTSVEIAAVQNGLLTQEGEVTKMQAEVLTFDAVLYQVELWYTAPTPTATEKLDFKDAIFFNDIATNGTYALQAISSDETIIFGATVYAESKEEVPGTFVNDGLFGKFGEGQYEFDCINTYVAKWNATTEQYDIVYPQKGQLVVTLDENDNLLMTASFVGDDAIQYEITCTSKYDIPHLEYDSDCCPVERTYTATDIVILEDYAADYGQIYFQVTAADASDLIALYFFADASDADIVIPEGTYEINDTFGFGTVLASTGVGWDGSVNPSVYATLDGEYLNTLYFLVSGQVVVTKKEGKLHVEVNALNSYNIPVHVVYDAAGTGLENVVVDGVVGTQKMMIDGQLVIIRNGEAYSATGVRVK